MNELNEKYYSSKKRKTSFIKGFLFGAFVIPLVLIGLSFIFNKLGFFDFDLFVIFLFFGTFVMTIINYWEYKGEKDGK